MQNGLIFSSSSYRWCCLTNIKSPPGYLQTCKIPANLKVRAHSMTSQQKTRFILLPVQICGALAVLTQTAYRAAQGHEASSPFMTSVMWSCVVAGFLTMIGAVLQAHRRFRSDAGISVVLGLFCIFASANFAPYIAR